MPVDPAVNQAVRFSRALQSGISGESKIAPSCLILSMSFLLEQTNSRKPEPFLRQYCSV